MTALYRTIYSALQGQSASELVLEASVNMACGAPMHVLRQRLLLASSQSILERRLEQSDSDVKECDSDEVPKSDSGDHSAPETGLHLAESRLINSSSGKVA